MAQLCNTCLLDALIVTPQLYSITGQCYHISSLSEGRASELIENSAADFIRHTERQLVRIYPAATRAGSSNFNPFPYWDVGCQIVALNYQTNRKEMRMYRGRFRENGDCGYVLKPAYLTDGSDAACLRDRETILRKYFKVRIVSGQQLPKADDDSEDILDPYVSLKIQGHPADTFKFKTKHVSNNGFSPYWNETVETFIRVPELAVVCFTVKDRRAISSNRFIGSYALPFNSLMPGIVVLLSCYT